MTKTQVFTDHITFYFFTPQTVLVIYKRMLFLHFDFKHHSYLQVPEIDTKDEFGYELPIEMLNTKDEDGYEIPVKQKLKSKEVFTLIITKNKRKRKPRRILCN